MMKMTRMILQSIVLELLKTKARNLNVVSPAAAAVKTLLHLHRLNQTESPMDNEHGNNNNEELPAGSEEEEEEEESMLLATQAGFNKLLLVLRDEQVMRFVKYVSAAATGSRWDIYGEYEVGMVTDD
jgi:hypothetical protein